MIAQSLNSFRLHSQSLVYERKQSIVETELNAKLQHEALTIKNLEFDVQHAKRQISLLEQEINDKHSLCSKLSQKLREV
jgi:hypothetical protein